ncbi:hypothetical protein [Pseudomonas cichorii]|uniref:hypothetical protein n=1 Tax=Pseudomonas cichorii TaxID=36746 RepID=UPI001C8906ED|nr:hypothetical protein [Pseudomonas cichorii]MBX8493721.1 hypothetical protein [Pseudomonas cichorii]MBX8513275.1 hypothetical protein [Pseudomonas cichorii]
MKKKAADDRENGSTQMANNDPLYYRENACMQKKTRSGAFMKRIMLLLLLALAIPGCSYFSFQEDNCTDNPQMSGCDGEHGGHRR